MSEINPAWVSAPYEESFLIGLPPARPGWSRRRRLRHYRLAWAKIKRDKVINQIAMVPVLFRHANYA